jgi:hypothetical protein
MSEMVDRLRKFCGVPAAVQREAASMLERLEGVEQKYNELLYAVATKHPGETRHETALRYIRERERRIDRPISAVSAESRRQG